MDRWTQALAGPLAQTAGAPSQSSRMLAWGLMIAVAIGLVRSPRVSGLVKATVLVVGFLVAVHFADTTGAVKTAAPAAQSAVKATRPLVDEAQRAAENAATGNGLIVAGAVGLGLWLFSGKSPAGKIERPGRDRGRRGR